MDNCEPLRWYGALVLLITIGFILVPYLRGKADLISAWNILLLGIAIFLGLGCFEAATAPMRFRGLDWFEPTKDEVNWFLAASTIFLITLFVSYYFDPVSRALTARSLNRWPQVSTGMIFYVLIVCFAIIMAVPFLWGVPFVGQVMLKLNHKAIVFIPVFSFLLWYRNKLNPVWLMIFIATFLIACLLGVLSGGGRRLPLSVVFGPIIFVYMTHVRRWRPSRGLVAIGIAFVGLSIIAIMYNAVRHFDRTGEKRARSASAVIEEVKSFGERDWMGKFARNKLFYFSQQVVHYSMITKRFVSTDVLEPQTLNTLKFIAVYPMPRQLWAEKPRQLGIVILRDAVGYPASSWGCGIAGHAAYEGGLIVAAIYGYLAAMGVRMIDVPLRRQPTNPFLIAILATASTHILAWPRGDLANMTIEIAQCFLFAIVLGISGRIIFGTEYAPQSELSGSTQHYFHHKPVRQV